jgi:hypothetical protein
MNWAIYALSIIDDIKRLGEFAGCCMVLVGVIAAGFYTMHMIGGFSDDERDKIKQIAANCKMIAIVCAVISTLIFFLPSRKGIVEAYLMHEGAKVVTVDNADKAMKNFSGKVDRLIKAIEGIQ